MTRSDEQHVRGLAIVARAVDAEMTRRGTDDVETQVRLLGDFLEAAELAVVPASVLAELRAEQLGPCSSIQPGTGYRCELPPGHSGDHRAFLNVSADYRSLIPERQWNQDACPPCPGIYKGGSC